MKTAEVIEQYKNGRRDFRGESLRGCNFKKQDLSGADFSGCDLRGANFSLANLTEAQFEKAKAGLRKRSLVILLIAALILIVISSFFSALVGVFVAYIFDQSSSENQIVGWVSLVFLLF
ncbi:MAG: pentapeptide repeat-containing protein, partial [Microcystaceae cyanobacterium]